MPVEGPAGEKSTRGRQRSGEAVSGKSTQGAVGLRCAGNSGTVVSAGGRDAGHVRYVAWWPTSAYAA
jgi:hypothetical protein